MRYMPHDAVAFLGCVFILVGLFVSRAMMSMGMMILIGNAVLNLKVVSNCRTFFSQSHLVLLTAYFLLLLLSYFWSEDTHYFNERLQIALPFLIMPFAFHSMSKWDKQWFDWLFALFIFLLIGGMSWSLFQYAQHKDTYDAGYGLSQVIPTPFKNDHIRFSLAVVLGICFCVDLISRYTNPIIRVLLSIAALYAIIYLHILSAKTGILVFYFISFLFLLKLIFQKRFRKAGTIFLVMLLSLPFIMYAFSASFRNKISYVQYSLSQIRNDNKDPNISDEGRIISYKYAIDCIKKNPVIGVGAGDVFDIMKTYYDRDFPKKNVMVLLPHNQFLMTGMGVGVVGMLYLLILQWVLFRLSFKRGFLYFAFWCMMFFTMMIEPLYETQYGTCMFLFFLLLLLQRRIKTE